MTELTFDVNNQSDFPSLGGGSQAAQNHGQSVWPPRAGQQATQRQTNQQPPQQGNQQNEKEQGNDSLFRGMDDFRQGAQGPGTQLPGSNQPPSSNPDEFPSLRDAAPGIGSERRGSQLQNSAYSGYGGGLGFSGMNQQPRNPLNNPLGGQQDTARLTSPLTAGGGKSATLTLSVQGLKPTGLPNARSPIPQTQGGTIGQGSLNPTVGRAPGSSIATHDQSQETQPNSADDTVPTDLSQIEITPWTELSPADQRGMQGFLALQTGRIFRNRPTPEVASLMRGIDLSRLGMDLNSSEPLHKTWSGPFGNLNSLPPVIEPEYHLPDCYSVPNVQHLPDRVPSFSEDTLFHMFYTLTQDVMQVIVAEELTRRKWRYHKVEKAWMTRDEQSPPPVTVEEGVEQGMYVWWDVKQWKRVRRSTVLKVAELEDPEGGIERGAEARRLVRGYGGGGSIGGGVGGTGLNGNGGVVGGTVGGVVGVGVGGGGGMGAGMGMGMAAGYGRM